VCEVKEQEAEEVEKVMLGNSDAVLEILGDI
jgi:hypothetical protein